MKKLFRVFVVLTFLVLVGVLAALYYVDTLAKRAVERGGQYALGVSTSLDEADIQPLAGAFEMQGLNVANPSGYQSPHFLTLGEGKVTVSLASLMQDTVRLPLLRLSEIDLVLEKAQGKANYQEILDNLKKVSDRPADPDAKKFVIDEVAIRDVTVHVNTFGQNLNVPIEAITLKNVGTGGGGAGVDLAQLSGVIMKSVLAAVVQAGGGLLPADVLGELSSGLSELASLEKLAELADVKALGELGDIAAEASTSAEDLKSKADEIANKAKESLGGILGDKPKNDQ